MAQWNKSTQAYRPQDTTNHEVVMISDEDGNIINTFGAASNVIISSGALQGYSVIHKFGRNPSVGGAPETIWMYGGKYVYLTSPSTIYAHSTDTEDSATGTGARTITVQGLDANYNLIEETITSRSGIASTNLFLRVFRAFVATAGTTTTNEGNVLISTAANGGGVVLADIGLIGTGTTFGLGQTQLALYTIPAGKTGYLTSWNIGVGSYNDQVTSTLKTRKFGSDAPFRSTDIMDIPGGLHTKNYSIPIKLTEKTDVEVIAIASTGTQVSSAFEIILVDNA